MVVAGWPCLRAPLHAADDHRRMLRIRSCSALPAVRRRCPERGASPAACALLSPMLAIFAENAARVPALRAALASALSMALAMMGSGTITMPAAAHLHGGSGSLGSLAAAPLDARSLGALPLLSALVHALGSCGALEAGAARRLVLLAASGLGCIKEWTVREGGRQRMGGGQHARCSSCTCPCARTALNHARVHVCVRQALSACACTLRLRGMHGLTP